MPLKLRIPRIDAVLDPALEIRTVYVEEWADALPFADPLRAFRMLFDRGATLNRAPLKPSLRADLLERLLPPYVRLAERHASRHGNQSASAFERYRDEADAARQVAVQLAFGYKLLLAETADHRSLFGRQRLPRLACQRATQLLIHALLHAYHEYLPPPRTIWPELHELLTFAHANGLSGADAGGRGLRGGFADGVAVSCARIALLSAADPLHMPYGQVWQAFDWLSTDRQALVVVPSTGAAQAPTTLVMSADHDGPPRRAGDLGQTLPAGAWLVDPGPVCAVLDRLAARIPDAAGVARALASPARRADERVPGGGHVRVAAGLSTIHHFLGGAPAEHQAPARAEPSTEHIATIDDFDPEDTLPRRHMYSSDAWQLVNRSLRGVCLQRERRSVNPPLVGEVVGMRVDGDVPAEAGAVGGPWAIGYVRWLSIDSGGRHHIGVEMTSTSARAVWLRPPSGVTRAALVLASRDTGVVRIAVPRGTYEPGAELKLEVNGRQMQLKATQLGEYTSSVECIHCEP